MPAPCLTVDLRAKIDVLRDRLTVLQNERRAVADELQAIALAHGFRRVAGEFLIASATDPVLDVAKQLIHALPSVERA